jgi:hypothetical protein
LHIPPPPISISFSYTFSPSYYPSPLPNFRSLVPILFSFPNLYFPLLTLPYLVSQRSYFLLSFLSFVSLQASNETQIGASSVFLRHFVALLLASFGSGSPMYEVSQIAFEIFQNISTRLDLTGSKRMSQSLWLEDCLVDPKSLPQLKPRSSASASSKLDNLPISSLLLSYIFASLQQCLDREQIKRGLDLLSKLAMSADNVELFSCAPEGLLATLVELLCANASSSEPLYLNDPKQTLPGAKGGKLPACASSFFSDISDTEIRDLSLEAIWSLCTYSQVIDVHSLYHSAAVCPFIAYTPVSFQITFQIDIDSVFHYFNCSFVF